MDIAEIIDERNRYRRALTHLTKGEKQLELMAEILGEVNLKRPEEAILHCRRGTLDRSYHDLPLCELEQLMVKRADALMILFAYQIVAPAIERQLRTMQRGTS